MRGGRRAGSGRIAPLRLAAMTAVLLLAGCAGGSESPMAQQPPAAGQPAAGAATGAAAGAVAGKPDPWWLPRYDFALEVDGKPSPNACFFQERDSSRLLINAPEVPKVCIITQAGKMVTAIERSKVKFEGEADAARLLPGAEKDAPATTYSMDSSSVVFYVGSNRLKIVPKRPLVGPTGKDELLQHSPLYRKGMEAYVPEASEVAWLKSYHTPVEIEVFFGTWCPHCKVLVPKFMKTIDVVSNPYLKVSYHGVPQAFANYDPATSRNVKGIPTFIVTKGGQEIGRIPGEPTNGTIEHAVAEILRAAPK